LSPRCRPNGWFLGLLSKELKFFTPSFDRGDMSSPSLRALGAVVAFLPALASACQGSTPLSPDRALRSSGPAATPPLASGGPAVAPAGAASSAAGEPVAPGPGPGPGALGAPVSATTLPGRIFVERRNSTKLLNFDFILENRSATPWTIAALEVSVFDARGALVLRKFINGNGFNPGVRALPDRRVEPGGSIAVFNPFYAFDAEVDLAELRYEFTFESADGKREASLSARVRPEEYAGRAALGLPLRGRLIVHDGHDFYAHHRRVDVTHPAAKQFEIRSNFARYSYDFCNVDAAGALFRGAGERNEDWYSFGAPVVAPAAGTVVAAVDAVDDNEHGAPPRFRPESLRENPMALFGNYVVIDHGGGEHSLMAHLQRGSVRVARGERVARGAPIAKMGASGDAGNPHLHYELRAGAGRDAEGLPSYFTDFTRLLGSTRAFVKKGQVDSGDFVFAGPAPR
jgi:murein DD-endopeptidase MepM/ murein hydrolase activator NlpD